MSKKKLRILAYMRCMGIDKLKIGTDNGKVTIVLLNNVLYIPLESNKADVVKHAVRYIETTVTAKLGYYVWERLITFVNANSEDVIKHLKEGDILFSTEK